MALKTRKPTSKGRRFMTGYDFSEITRREPEWNLVEPRRKTGGRNNLGRMTMRHIGGGHKQHYRVIDQARQRRDSRTRRVDRV
jgi:large subunit ribosomal protein L2